jgi:hypothetical protein
MSTNPFSGFELTGVPDGGAPLFGLRFLDLSILRTNFVYRIEIGIVTQILTASRAIVTSNTPAEMIFISRLLFTSFLLLFYCHY